MGILRTWFLRFCGFRAPNPLCILVASSLDILPGKEYPSSWERSQCPPWKKLPNLLTPLARRFHASSTHDPNVRESTRKRIQEVITRFNYQPNQAARSLAGGHTHILGLVIPTGVASVFTDPYFPTLIRGISICLPGA